MHSCVLPTRIRRYWSIREIYSGRGVGVGVGVGEADGSSEGNSTGVEKFGPRGLLLGDGPLIGTGVSCGSIMLTLAGVAAAAAVCAPAFVFGPVLILLGGFVPSWAALVELPLKPLCPAVAPVVAPV
jgi:hypothetical protein